MSLQEYLKETRAELKHVAWPTQRQVISYTLIVILISLITAALLGVFDFVFGLALDKILLR